MNFLLLFVVPLFSIIYLIIVAPVLRLFAEKFTSISACFNKGFDISCIEKPLIEFLKEIDQIALKDPYDFESLSLIEYNFEDYKKALVDALANEDQSGRPMSGKDRPRATERIIDFFFSFILHNREEIFDKFLDTFSEVLKESEAVNFADFSTELVYRILKFPGRFKYLEKMLRLGFKIEYLDFFLFNALSCLDGRNIEEKIHFVDFLVNELHLDIINTPIACPDSELTDYPVASDDLFIEHFENIRKIKNYSRSLERSNYHYPIHIVLENCWNYPTFYKGKKRMFELLVDFGANLDLLNEFNESALQVAKNQSLI